MVLVVLAALLIGQALLNRARTLHTARWLSGMTIRLRMTLLEHIASARWDYIARQRGAKLQHALASDIDRVQASAYQLLLVLQHAVLFAVYVGVSLLLSPAMTAFAALIGVIALAIMSPVRRQAFALGEDMTRRGQAQVGIVSDFLNGLKTAKSFGVEDVYLRDMNASLYALQDGYMRYSRLSTSGQVIVQALNAVALACFMFVATTIFHATLPTLVVFIALFLRIAPRLQGAQHDIEQLLTAVPAFTALQNQLREFSQQRTAPSLRLASPIRLQREIALDSVCFRYEGAEREAVSNISLRLRANEITAIIGPSGGGKTTLADLLMGLLSPTSGEIRIDGARLSPESAPSWRRRLAYVPQDTVLLNDTVRANLLLAAPEATEQDLWDALDLANATSFVRNLSLGLDSPLGDRGAQLSGGERQRVAIARALVRKPDLLILDEATSALDQHNQTIIAAALERLRGRMTIVTIAHRPSMIALADWVVTVEDGRLVESGALSELTKTASALSRVLASERGVALR